VIDRASRKFWDLLLALPQDIQETAHKQYRLYKTDPDHPGLELKSLKYTKNPVWSVRITDNHRAMAIRTTDDQGQTVMFWFWIGPHREYDKLIKRL
jgi:hypothetical protein